MASRKATRELEGLEGERDGQFNGAVEGLYARYLAESSIEKPESLAGGSAVASPTVGSPKEAFASPL